MQEGEESNGRHEEKEWEGDAGMEVLRMDKGEVTAQDMNQRKRSAGQEGEEVEVMTGPRYLG